MTTYEDARTMKSGRRPVRQMVPHVGRNSSCEEAQAARKEVHATWQNFYNNHMLPAWNPTGRPTTESHAEISLRGMR